MRERLVKVRAEAKRHKFLEQELLETPDKQTSLTDPDARIMDTRGTGLISFCQYQQRSVYHRKGSEILF